MFQGFGVARHISILAGEKSRPDGAPATGTLYTEGVSETYSQTAAALGLTTRTRATSLGRRLRAIAPDITTVFMIRTVIAFRGSGSVATMDAVIGAKRGTTDVTSPAPAGVVVLRKTLKGRAVNKKVEAFKAQGTSLDTGSDGGAAAARQRVVRRLSPVIALLMTVTAVWWVASQRQRSPDGDSVRVLGSETTPRGAQMPATPADENRKRLLLAQRRSEVAADGSLRQVPLRAGDIDTTSMKAQPNGHIVMLGTRDVAKGVPRTDGPTVDGVETSLLVVDPAGTVTVEHNVRVRGETVDLLGVTPTSALLQRSVATADGKSTGSSRIVAHDITSGTERVIASTNRRGWAGDLAGDTLAIVVAGDMAPYGTYQRTGPCGLLLVDVQTGQVAERDIPACSEVYDVSVSPGARYAAVSYGKIDGTGPGLWLSIVDLHTGELQRPEELLGYPIADCPASRCPDRAKLVGYLGMAWGNVGDLEIALEDLARSSAPGPLINAPPEIAAAPANLPAAALRIVKRGV